MFNNISKKLAYEYDQTRFTIPEEIKSTLPKLFYNYYSQIKSIQIKSNIVFLWEGKTGVPGEKPLMVE